MRTRRLPLLDPMRAIVSTFRKVSTETDQAQGPWVPARDTPACGARHVRARHKERYRLRPWRDLVAHGRHAPELAGAHNGNYVDCPDTANIVYRL